MLNDCFIISQSRTKLIYPQKERKSARKSVLWKLLNTKKSDLPKYREKHVQENKCDDNSSVEKPEKTLSPHRCYQCMSCQVQIHFGGCHGCEVQLAI